jgi:hypothetical protein
LTPFFFGALKGFSKGPQAEQMTISLFNTRLNCLMPGPFLIASPHFIHICHIFHVIHTDVYSWVKNSLLSEMFVVEGKMIIEISVNFQSFHSENTIELSGQERSF